MKNILITAGGTSEQIDSVRSISNHATGSLGSMIADVFAQSKIQITYVCGEKSVLPKHTNSNLEIVKIKSVKDLINTIEILLSNRNFDCVIHSMAVSDYTTQAVISVDDMVENILQEVQTEKIQNKDMAHKIKNIILESGKQFTDQKMSSKSTEIAVLLNKTPKVIKRIKELQPQTLLIGFKLLSQVPEVDLLKAGQDLLEQNNCDFVFANDLSNIENEVHKAILLDKNGILNRANTKQEIAELTYKYVNERIEL